MNIERGNAGKQKSLRTYMYECLQRLITTTNLSHLCGLLISRCRELSNLSESPPNQRIHLITSLVTVTVTQHAHDRSGNGIGLWLTLARACLAHQREVADIRGRVGHVRLRIGTASRKAYPRCGIEAELSSGIGLGSGSR